MSLNDNYLNLFEEAFDNNDASSVPYTKLSHQLSVEERYTDRTLLGEGALKKVYKCFDQKIQRWIALAQLHPGLEKDYNELFIHEAWLTASLNHPNIIKIYDIGMDESSCPYFTMDLKSNHTLEQLVNHGTPLQELLRIFLRVCDAVSYAHQQHIFHLDLKPDNIQCDSYDEVLVCDWGLGKLGPSIDVEAVDNTALVEKYTTLYGQIKGTPGYMAPEQIHASPDKDHRSDIYALGSILHFILTKQPANTGDSIEAILSATTKGNRRPSIKEFPELNIPVGLSCIVQQCLQLNASDRYRSVNELSLDIRRYLNGQTTASQQANALTRLAYFSVRHRKIMTASMMVVILATLALAFKSRLSYTQQQYEYLEQDHDALNHAISQGGLEYLRYIRENIAFDERREKRINYLTTLFRKNPQNKNIHEALFFEYCTTMDFQRALSHQQAIDQRHHSVNSISQLIAPFANYNFSPQHPPTPAEIHQFIKGLKLEKSQPHHYHVRELLLNAVRYQDHLKNLGHRNTIFVLLLDRFNASTAGYSSVYDRQTKSLTLVSEENLTIPTYDTTERYFKYFNLQHLQLNLPSPQMIRYKGMQCKTLDISQCQALNLHAKGRVSINDLQHIKIAPHHDKNRVQKMIFCTGRKHRVIINSIESSPE